MKCRKNIQTNCKEDFKCERKNLNYMSIYLDNAATTKPCAAAIDEINRGLTELYGNPSSLHSKGLQAQLAVDEARKIIAGSIGCDSRELYFTSGATESNNMAVRGTVAAYGKRKPKIITTTVEHASIRETINELEMKGFEVIRIAPRKNGEFVPQDFIEAIDEKTCLISMMLVNNENGYILHVKEVFNAVKHKFPDVITHCDCVQGFMKLNINVKELYADIISLSAHKIHGAKGVGALYIKKGIRVVPIITGGKQEKGIRSGTESVPLILGFGAAVKYMSSDINQRFGQIKELKSFLLENIKKIDGINLNSAENASPYIVNISVCGIRSEILLHFLEEREIYVSSGSACSKGAQSGVLEQFGVSRTDADSAIRISMDASTTKDELLTFVSSLADAKQRIMSA